jgi:RNA polymerase sigma factor (sigma-70 family)
MDAHAILSRLWRDEDVTEAKANFPLWVMWRYAAKHGGARLDPLREDMEQVAVVATERALRTYDANKGTLPSWIRLLVERDLSKLLEAERNQTRGNVTPPHDELAPERRDAIDHLDPPGEASTERDVFERWRRRVVLEAVKGLPERQAKAVTLYFRLDNWPYRRTDAQVGDELYVTAKAAEQLRRRGVEGLREMGQPSPGASHPSGPWCSHSWPHARMGPPQAPEPRPADHRPRARRRTSRERVGIWRLGGISRVRGREADASSPPRDKPRSGLASLRAP